LEHVEKRNAASKIVKKNYTGRFYVKINKNVIFLFESQVKIENPEFAKLAEAIKHLKVIQSLDLSFET